MMLRMMMGSMSGRRCSVMLQIGDRTAQLAHCCAGRKLRQQQKRKRSGMERAKRHRITRDQKV